MEPENTQNVEERPVTALPRIGVNLAASLERIGIFQIKDLLFHLPFRFQDRTNVVPIGSLLSGQTTYICGRITNVRVSFGHRRTLNVNIDDDTGKLRIRLFHFNNRQRVILEGASWIRCFGEARTSRNGLEMVHPEYSVFHYEPPARTDNSLTPIYRLTEGISQLLMRSMIQSALKLCADCPVTDLIPQEVRKNLQLSDLGSALEYVHAPPVDDIDNDLDEVDSPALQRLIFEELLSHQVARRQQKQLRQKTPATAMQPQGDLSRRLKGSLSFEPTQSQRKVIHEIISDLKNTTPMLRLVQGDVGSGKTVVAAAAAAWVVDAGYQVAIMAPTELLAEQHFKSFSDWFVPLGVDVLLLTGRLTAKQRKNVTNSMQFESSNIIIGTHALFQESVEFNNLGMVVVDEQHRFGVGQRYALRGKGVLEDRVPHQLIMTATPIPRSLAMTFYADLDVSSITELPPGRIPVATQVIPTTARVNVIDEVDKMCSAGFQVYWVCPLIDKSDLLDVESATEAEKFVKRSLPRRRVELIHGRMKSVQRDKVMNEFRTGDIDVLVATTVIEVGVDVPNASLMVIESAERLGLAQLHQLRGRVGRGSHQAKCILVFKGDLSKMAKERLSLMMATNDGFKIAETDLKHRGAGELLGTRQTGAQLFRIAELPRDMGFIEEVNKAAALILSKYPQFAERLIRRWTVRAGEYSAV